MARGFERPPWWAVIVLVAGLVLLAIGLPIASHRSGETLSKSEIDREAAAASAADAADASAARASKPVVVSVLSDSHAYNAGSWYRRTVVAGAITGVRPGGFASTPGADTGHIALKLQDAVTGADWVLIQGGTNDLLSAATPQQAAEGDESLVQAVQKAGPKPVLLLIPPSSTRGPQVVEANSLLRSWASANNVPVVDDYTVVANPDGTWKSGLTNDGKHAVDPAGTTLMAQAVLQQLPPILGKVSAAPATSSAP